MNKLAEYKKKTGQTQEQLAAALEIDRGHLSKLLRGKAYPSRKLMVQIENATGGLVPVTAWFEDRGAA